MAETDPMSIDERRKYLHKMRIRYWQAKGKKERSRLLDEMQAVTGLHRKSLLRLIHGELARKPRRKQRSKTYGAEVGAAIRKIAESLDYPCAERLKPSLVRMAEHLEAHGELHLTPEVRRQLETISISSIRRRLPRSERSTQRIAHRRGLPRQTFAQKQCIPMRRIDWAERRPGHFEVDLVHHCGLSADGQYVHTLQLLDVATGWSECVAVLGRSYLVMRDGFARLLRRLPFEIRELHPDNGAEFLNAHLVRYWRDKVKAELSRSRPYHKNDNRFVEENNHSLLRAYLGHSRFDTLAHLQVLRRLYDQLWLYHNLFQLVMRLHSKQAVAPFRYRRQFDPAKPPLDRLIELQCLDDAARHRLEKLRQATNPLILRDQINDLIDQLMSLPTLKNSPTVNVFDTLIKEADFSLR